jgi:hypothetical protein
MLEFCSRTTLLFACGGSFLKDWALASETLSWVEAGSKGYRNASFSCSTIMSSTASKSSETFLPDLAETSMYLSLLFLQNSSASALGTFLG